MFTAAVRLCLHPLNRAQMNAQLASQKARAALAPAVQKLQRKYQHDPLRVQRETIELYRANGVKLAPGIGLGLVQLPVFFVVYRLFVSPTIGGHPLRPGCDARGQSRVLANWKRFSYAARRSSP